MKISKRQLRRIVKEEKRRVVRSHRRRLELRRILREVMRSSPRSMLPRVRKTVEVLRKMTWQRRVTLERG